MTTRMLRRLLFPTTLLMLGLPALTHAATLSVPSQYKTIQSAVNAAHDGDTVLVADGTYTGNGNTNINSGGGFGGVLVTIKSAGGAGKCVIDCTNTASYGFELIDARGVSIDGFTIKNASMGIYASGATVTITNCNLINNSFGAYLLSDYETITGCNFSSNSQGLVIQTDNNIGPIVKDCAFSNNEYQGLYMDASVGFEQSLPSVTNCNFSGNGASGLELLGLQCVVDGCVFSNNEGEAAGGIAADSPYRFGSYLIQNCTFVGNIGGSGGGVSLVDEGSSISNCTFVGNVGTKGGGIYSANNDKVVNCSFTANTGENGAIYFSLGSESIVANSICYGDNNKNGTEIGSPYIVSYSDVQGGATGTGNINADPLFVRAPNLPDYGDLHLKPHSPCIGAGTAVFSDYNGNINQNAPTTDKDGNTRPNPPSIGAYEIGTPPLAITGVRLGLPTLVTSGNSRILEQSVYIQGSGAGPVSGYWYLDGNQTQYSSIDSVDLSSGNWVKLGDFQSVLTGQHTLEFLVDSNSAVTAVAKQVSHRAQRSTPTPSPPLKSSPEDIYLTKFIPHI